MIRTALLLAATLLQVPNVPATFTGTFKSADRKFLELQVEEGETMRMYVTHGTKFIRNGHAAKSAEFHSGEHVSVDAERDARMNLVALRVELKK